MPDGANRHLIRPCPSILRSADLFPLPALPLQFTGHGTQATGGLCAASTGKAHQPPGKNNRTSDKPLCGRNPPNSTKHDKQESFIMAKFYCKYCGNAYSSVQSLTSTTCSRHPDGVGKGRHALYEGDEAPEYTCKYCGKRASTIASLTSQMCPRHPDGNGKGRHSPSL